MAQFPKGSRVKMTDDALENYGEEYRDRAFTITHISTKYMPASEFFAKGQPAGYHPGYDESVAPQALYDFEELQFSLYQWEVRQA